MLMRIYLPQTKKVLVLFGFVLLPIIFFSFVAYENLQETQNGKKFLLVCLASIIILVVVFLTSFLIREVKLRRKIWSVKTKEESSDEMTIDLCRRLGKITKKAINLNDQMIVLIGQMRYKGFSEDDIDGAICQLIQDHKEVIKKFLFSAISLHNASKIICAGQSGHLIKFFLIYNRNGQKHNILIIPFITKETFEKIFQVVVERKITLIITLYCESNYEIKGIKIVSLPNILQVLKGVQLNVRETMEKQGYIF